MSYIQRSEYLDIAKGLSVGGSVYVPHEGCTTSAKMWVTNGEDVYGAWCNKCGMSGSTQKGLRKLSELAVQGSDDEDDYVPDVALPPDISYSPKEWPLEARVWLYKADVRNPLIEHYGIGYSKKQHRVILPVYGEDGKLQMFQGRGLAAYQTKYKNVRAVPKNSIFFKSWVHNGLTDPMDYNKVVVVEDALSVTRVGKHIQAVAAMGTSLSQTQYNYLSKFKEVVFWLDDDKAGLNGSKKAVQKLSLVTTCKRIRSEEDPKMLSDSEIKKYLELV